MKNQQRIAVAGATGRVGRHVVNVLEAQGHDVVAISRSNGVDVITGDDLAEALAGVTTVIDAATGPSPDQAAATSFFTSSARNLQEYGKRAGVGRLVVVSIIGIDRFTGGYQAAKLEHEHLSLAGPIPARILRAAQFPRVRPGARRVVPERRREPGSEDANAARRREDGRRGARGDGDRGLDGLEFDIDSGDRRPARGEARRGCTAARCPPRRPPTDPRGTQLGRRRRRPE